MFLRSRIRKASRPERRRSARSRDILGAVAGRSGIPLHPVERDQPPVQLPDDSLAGIGDCSFLTGGGGCIRSRFTGLGQLRCDRAAKKTLEGKHTGLREKEILAFPVRNLLAVNGWFLIL